MENTFIMPTATQTKPKPKETPVVPAFGIEANHPRNSDLLVQGVEGCRLRSRIKATKEVFAKEDGEVIQRPAPGNMFDGLPANIPGMQLHINPKDGTYMVLDPLEDQERTLERIKAVMDRQSGVRTSKTLRPAKSVEGSLGKDEMKTLVREMYHLVKNDHAIVVKGSLPDMVDIEDLPGDFLLNASNRNQWNQPRYEKDLEEWRQKMDKLRD